MSCKTEKAGIHMPYSFLLILYVLLIFLFRNVSVVNANNESYSILAKSFITM